MWTGCCLCYRTLRERILELDAQIEDLNESHQKAVSPEESAAPGGTTAAELTRKLHEASEKASALEKELTAARKENEEQDSHTSALKHKNTTLEEELRNKEHDMKVMEEKYKRYLEKARSVSSSSSTSCTDVYGGDPGGGGGQGDVGMMATSGEPWLRNQIVQLKQKIHQKDVELGELKRRKPVGKNVSVQVREEANFESLQEEVRAYRREMKEAHALFIDPIAYNSPPPSALTMEQGDETKTDGRSRFQSPLKSPQTSTPRRVFSEKFRIFEQRSKQLGVDPMSSKGISPEQGRGGVSSMWGDVEQELFMKCGELRQVQDELDKTKYELHSLLETHSPHTTQHTDAEKENQSLKQTIAQLEDSLQAASSQPQQLQSQLQHANKQLDKMKKAYAQAKDDLANQEMHYVRILDKLKKDLKKMNNPTNNLLGWFLKRDSW